MYDNDIDSYKKPFIKLATNVDIVTELCGEISSVLNTTTSILNTVLF